MLRARAVALPLVLLAGFASLGAFLLGRESRADLENQVFTSRADRLRLVVPRGWRASDQPSYPGLLLWMARNQPQGQMVLTSEAFTRELYCRWDRTCRLSHDALPAKYACALRVQLEKQHMRVGPVQAGPKENEENGIPSIWFEYDDGKHFLRQAIAFTTDRAISLVLSAPTNDARGAHSRAFEQALRTMHLLSVEETEKTLGIDAAVIAPVDDAGVNDSTVLADAAVLDAGVMFESAPAKREDPVGPCPDTATPSAGSGSPARPGSPATR